MIGERGNTTHTLYIGIGDDDPRQQVAATHAEVTLDENWSPYGQATISFPVVEVDDLQSFDPTVDTFIDVEMTMENVQYPMTFIREFDNLMLRSRSIDHKSAVATITLATLDALLHDHVHVSDTTLELVPPSGVNTVRKVVDWVLDYIDMTISSGNVDPAGSTTFVPADNPWKTGQSAWEYISPIVARAELRLWCDENQVWHLRNIQPTPTVEADFYTDVTVTELTDTIDLDRTVFDSVLVTYQWTDSSGDPQTAYDAAQNGANSRLVYNITYNRPYPGAGAAQRILDDRIKRRRAMTLSAVSDYRVSPGTVMTLNASSLPPLAAVVSSVRWSFPDDEMQIRTRDVEEA